MHLSLFYQYAIAERDIGVDMERNGAGMFNGNDATRVLFLTRNKPGTTKEHCTNYDAKMMVGGRYEYVLTILGDDLQPGRCVHLVSHKMLDLPHFCVSFDPIQGHIIAAYRNGLIFFDVRRDDFGLLQ